MTVTQSGQKHIGHEGVMTVTQSGQDHIGHEGVMTVTHSGQKHIGHEGVMTITQFRGGCRDSVDGGRGGGAQLWSNIFNN